VRVLATNDDGIAAPGLQAMADALVRAGHDVFVAAPAHDCSGQGAAIGPLHLTATVVFSRVRVPGVEADAFAIEGPPALAVIAGCLGGFGRAPDLVVSGINAGANTGRAVLHSGTVGAVLTAANLGISGLAVSQAAGDTQHWSAAAAIAVALLPYAAALNRCVANLNVPNSAWDEVRGVLPATLDATGIVQAAMREGAAGVLELHIPERRRPVAGTDSALLEAGYATVTDLVGPQRGGVDLAEVCHKVEGILTGRLAGPLSA
jgi:5'-nucleotidase